MATMETEIRDYLLEKLIRHEFSETEKMPSENELAHFFGTTRNRIRKVYETLEAMGYIDSRQGIGHFPRKKGPAIELALRGDIGFSEKMRQQGIAYQSRNVHCRPIDPKEGDKHFDNLRGEGKVYEICRLRIVQDKPATLHFSYVSSQIFPDIGTVGNSITSMFEYYLEEGYSSFASTGSELSVSFPRLAEQELLECGELVPLLILESDCYDKTSGKLLELTKIIYRSDLFKYKIKNTI